MTNTYPPTPGSPTKGSTWFLDPCTIGTPVIITITWHGYNKNTGEYYATELTWLAGNNNVYLDWGYIKQPYGPWTPIDRSDIPYAKLATKRHIQMLKKACAKIGITNPSIKLYPP